MSQPVPISDVSSTLAELAGFSNTATPMPPPAGSSASAGSPSADAPGGEAPGVHAQTLATENRTLRLGLLMVLGTICLMMLGITGALVFRIVQDGNHPQTIAITQAVLSVFPWMLCAMASVFLGKQATAAIASALLARLP